MQAVRCKRILLRPEYTFADLCVCMQPLLLCLASLLGLVDGLEDAVERLGLDAVDRLVHVNGNDIDLVGLGALEDVELAVDHVGAHVVVLAREYALQQQLLVGVEVDKVQSQVGREVGRHADDVAVLALERRACQDDTVVALVELVDRGFAERREPVPAVSVRQGDAGAHLVNVGLGMVLRGSGLVAARLARGREQREQDIPRRLRCRASVENRPDALLLCSCRSQPGL